MAKERISPRMKTQIQTLLKAGMPIRKVAVALNISRQSVRKYSLESTQRAPDEESTKGKSSWCAVLPWERIAQLERDGATVAQLYKEYAPQASYSAFWRHLRSISPLPAAVTMRISHKPAERTQIDYCDGLPITDRGTGLRTKTQLFCGVLPFSSLLYAEFTLSQQLLSFIDSHDRMWAFFGGVTPYVVIDNLKSGVARAHRYDPDVNATYCEYANHMGFSVLPARPRRPKDKPTVEASVGTLQRTFYQEVREREFYSLAELNLSLQHFLQRLNNTVMKDYGASRAQRFESERSLLKPLPAVRHEPNDWKTAKVHADCHIQVERNYYSVPFTHIGKTVRVRITNKLIEVFAQDDTSIAVHTKLVGMGETSTHDQHYPEKKLSIQRFDVHSAKQQAARVGPHTTALVNVLIHEQYPLKYLRRIQGILRLVERDHVTHSALEYGCEQALKFNRPRLQFIKDCAEHFQAHGLRERLAKPEREERELHLHYPAATTGGAT